MAALQVPQVIAISLLIAVGFVSGIVLRTGTGLRAKNALERAQQKSASADA